MKYVTILLLLGIVGCTAPGEYARVTKSREFSVQSPMKVIVLPFTVDGNPNATLARAESDQISTALLTLGFSLIDRRALELKAAELGMKLDENPQPTEVQKLAQAVGAQGIFMGSVNYAYRPAESRTDPAHFEAVKNDSGKAAGMRYVGASSYSHEGSFYPNEMTAKLVSASDYEILFTAYVKPEYGVSNLSDELTEALKKQLPK